MSSLLILYRLVTTEVLGLCGTDKLLQAWSIAQAEVLLFSFYEIICLLLKHKTA